MAEPTTATKKRGRGRPQGSKNRSTTTKHAKQGSNDEGTVASGAVVVADNLEAVTSNTNASDQDQAPKITKKRKPTTSQCKDTKEPDNSAGNDGDKDGEQIEEGSKEDSASGNEEGSEGQAGGEEGASEAQAREEEARVGEEEAIEAQTKQTTKQKRKANVKATKAPKKTKVTPDASAVSPKKTKKTTVVVEESEASAQASEINVGAQKGSTPEVPKAVAKDAPKAASKAASKAVAKAPPKAVAKAAPKVVAKAPPKAVAKVATPNPALVAGATVEKAATKEIVDDDGDDDDSDSKGKGEAEKNGTNNNDGEDGEKDEVDDVEDDEEVEPPLETKARKSKVAVAKSQPAVAPRKSKAVVARGVPDMVPVDNAPPLRVSKKFTPGSMAAYVSSTYKASGTAIVLCRDPINTSLFLVLRVPEEDVIALQSCDMTLCAVAGKFEFSQSLIVDQPDVDGLLYVAEVHREGFDHGRVRFAYLSQLITVGGKTWFLTFNRDEESCAAPANASEMKYQDVGCHMESEVFQVSRDVVIAPKTRVIVCHKDKTSQGWWRATVVHVDGENVTIAYAPKTPSHVSKLKIVALDNVIGMVADKKSK